MMPIIRYRFFKRLLGTLLSCCFLSLLVACGSTGMAAGQPTPSPKPGTPAPTSTHQANQGDNGSSTATPVTMTVPVPTTQVSCPAPGTGRAAILAPLATHGHKTLVYYVSTGQDSRDQIMATLKKLDVTTGQKTDIITLLKASIKQAQVSTDGQWVLFVANVSVGGGIENRLQLVRMDGQGLQTLYCGTPDTLLDSGGVVWSNNQRTILMSLFGAKGSISSLNTQTGSVQVVLVTPMLVTSMLDNSRVYVTVPATDAPSNTLAILDTRKGSNQHVRDLITVFQQFPAGGAYPCWDADSSYDAATLYVSQCQAVSLTTGPGIAGFSGPSSVGTQSPLGGGLHIVYNNQQLAITQVRAVTANTLLLQTKSVHTPYGSMLNGLWAIHTDGTGRIRLASEGMLNSCAQTPWSNGSRDGMSYAFKNTSPDGTTASLGYGSLDGQQTTTFVTAKNAALFIVGWTAL